MLLGLVNYYLYANLETIRLLLFDTMFCCGLTLHNLINHKREIFDKFTDLKKGKAFNRVHPIVFYLMVFLNRCTPTANTVSKNIFDFHPARFMMRKLHPPVCVK